MPKTQGFTIWEDDKFLRPPRGFAPPKNEHDNRKSPCLVGDTSSSGCFSTVILVFRGVKFANQRRFPVGFPGENLDVFKTHEDFPNGNTIVKPDSWWKGFFTPNMWLQDGPLIVTV